MSGPLKFTHKTAILVDWDNVKFRLLDSKILKNKGIKEDYVINYNRNPLDVIKFFASFLSADELLYRIYVYTAYFPSEIRDMSGKALNVDRDGSVLDNLYKAGNYTKKYRLNQSFINSIKKINFVALKTGRLAVRWDKETNKFDLEQKGVDMLIGLDMAQLAYKKLVDRIILFSYDTDLIPAVKTARSEGVQMVLPVVSEVIKHPPDDMLEHIDILRSKKYADIYSKLEEVKL